MRTLRSSILLSLVLVACGGEETPPVTPAPPPPPVAKMPAPAASPAPPPVADANPTERTPEQKARDEARAPLANAIMDAYTNAQPRFSPDRKKLLFSSRRDGNREFYLADVASPSAAPVLITHGSERAEDATFARDGKSVFFLRDTGADENFRIYQVGLDGKNETCLTPGPVMHRDSPFEGRRAKGTIVYSQRQVKAPTSEVVVQKVGGEPKVVYTDPGPSFVVDLAQDGKHALLVRLNSLSDTVLFDVDLAGGKARRVYPAEGKQVTIHDASYSIDGKHIVLSSDDGGEALYALDAATGAVQQQYAQTDPPTATLDNITVSPRGDRFAATVRMGDHSEGRIFDAKTLKVAAKIDAPLGDFSTSMFSEDGTKIAATITTPDRPTDVYAVDAKTGAVEPLRKDTRLGLDKLDPIETSIEKVPAFDGLSIPVIAYLPKGARTAGNRLPVLVEFHGGPASSSTVGWDTFARFYTALGYAFLEPNVRGSTGYGRAYEMADNREKRADWLKDLETVNAWTKAQPWADPNRVVVMGGSYGGYTVLMALTRQPTLWRAGVDIVGVANLFTFLQSTDQTIRSIFVEEFGDLDKDKDLLAKFSPLGQVEKIVAPLYVYAGQNDPRVPRGESDQVVQAMRTRGVPVEYQVAANEGHSLDHKENRVEFFTRVARFIEDNVK